MAGTSKTLLEALAEHVSETPDKPLFRWVDDKGKETKGLTYAAFDDATSKLASALVAPEGWALQPGQNVLLVYPPGLDFIVAFVACLKAGVVAVPVYPPRPGLSKDLAMFVSVQRSSKAEVALTNSLYNHAKRIGAFKQFFSGTKTKWPDLRWLVTDAAKVPSAKSQYNKVGPAPSHDSLAFLQYTSGSTSQPKGVEVTHGNLAHNLSAIVRALEASSATVVVSWLPCYHDMGLIGSLLGTAYCGGSGTYMSPLSFIKNPVLWVEMISKYRATHVQAPNFAYKLVVRKFKEQGAAAPKLDLSCVKHMFNAAEPIEAETLDDFQSTFTKFKLPATAMAPGYGLAEHTVYVCDRGELRLCVDKAALEKERRVVEVANASGPDAAAASWIVGCGNPHRQSEESGIQVRIVDEKSQVVLPEDQVGEIWIDSPSKARGYFGMPEKSDAEFKAVLRDADGAEAEPDRRWLRSGDLGFLHGGELFVCGRIKDLIIIRGRNHYPQDIEHSVEQADEAIRGGCVAAFTTADAKGLGEHLGVVAEVRDAASQDLPALSAKLRQRIAAEHGVTPYALVLIKARTIPKTTSGKISRFRARAAFAESQLQEVHRYVGAGAEFDAEEDKTDMVQAESLTLGEASTPPVSHGLVPIGSDVDPKTGGGSGASGEALLENLKEEVARLIEGDPAALDAATPLIQLGMDSMALTQFKGILANSYATEVGEPELFDEETTLETIRQRVEGAPPAARFLEDGAGADEEGAPAAPRPKAKQRKQSLFGCFKICGC